MLKKGETKKSTGKGAGVSKARRAAKTGAVDVEASAKTQKKPVKARTKAEATFRLEAPQAVQVFIAGCFNGWDPTASPLKQDGEGRWSCTMAIEPGEHEYRFVVDGVWCDDPTNVSRRWNEFGTENCVLIVR